MPEAPEDAAFLIPLRGVRAVNGTLTTAITAPAEAAARRESELWAHAAGQVVRVPVVENDVVRNGQELLALDATDARLEVHEALAALERARLSYGELTLIEEPITDAMVGAERQRVARIRSGLEEAEVRVEQAERRLYRTVARAPFDGRVASVEARLGEWVRAGDPLIRVVEIDPIHVEARVLDSELRWLRPGGAATVEFAAWPGESIAGRIRSIHPEVDRELRTAKVTVVLANPDGRLLPGMQARVWFGARVVGRPRVGRRENQRIPSRDAR